MRVLIAIVASRRALSFSLTGAIAFEGNLAPEIDARTGDYSPFVGRAYPDEVLFGHLHFHTELSFDAGLVGTSLSVHDAFRVARGEKIISNTGQPVQLIRPQRGHGVLLRMAEREEVSLPKRTNRLAWLTCPNSTFDSNRVLLSLANPNCGGGAR